MDPTPESVLDGRPLPAAQYAPSSIGNQSSILEVDSLNASGDDWDDMDSLSLTDSIIDYEYENGRRYHAYKAGTYPYPNDEAELDRMDLQHHVTTLLLGRRLHYAPLNNPKKVLDIGTGTGLWAIEFADLYPNASVIGTDLSPVQPSLVPDNLMFEISDVEGDWLMKHDSYDYIHSRYMLGSLTSFKETMAEAYKHLKPGGFLEIQEIDPRISSDDGTHHKAKWHCQFFDQMCEASGKYGKPIPLHSDYKGWMEEVGFVDVKQYFFKCPIGTWPKNKQLKEIGKYQYLHYNEGYEGLSVALFTRVLGWQLSELQVLLAQVRGELKDSSIHTYQVYAVLVGRKPYPYESARASPENDSSSLKQSTKPIKKSEPRFDANLVDMVRERMPDSTPQIPEIRFSTAEVPRNPRDIQHDKPMEADIGVAAADGTEEAYRQLWNGETPSAIKNVDVEASRQPLQPADVSLPE